MWPFKPRPVVDADTAAWHVDNFDWLLRQFGGGKAFADIRLVLPKPGFFPIDGERGHARAQRIFAQVKTYCGMAGWEVALVADDNPLSRPAPIALDTIGTTRYALGTFDVRGNDIQISYVPALLARPERLIATFAHELGHYLLATARERPLCADDETECLTDLTAVFMGFGVFLANTRFNVETMSDGVMQGWRMGSAGYLPEADLIFALALFLRIKQLDAAEARRCLKPHLAKQLRRAMQALPDDHADVVRLRATLADVERESAAGAPPAAAAEQPALADTSIGAANRAAQENGGLSARRF
jgi:hypothetical protein